MEVPRLSLLIVASILGCKREPAPEKSAPTPTPAVVTPDARAPQPPAAWYRASVRTPEGVEARFFLGVPAAGAPGQAVFRVGNHEVHAEGTFDGKTLKIPIAVHQTTLEATAGPDGSLAGSFTTAWRAWGPSTLTIAATKVAAPTLGELGTITPAAGAAPVDLKEKRTSWKVAMSESGSAKLTLDQLAPGEFSGMLFLDTGNINYVAGNGYGDDLVLTGFDGTSAYRIELKLAADRASGEGKYVGSHRLDWRETLTATRSPDFALAIRTRASQSNAKIDLPANPALDALPRGPLLVELGGSWCSTCRNMAPFLVELHREYAPRGLHMVTLLYEFSDDPEFDAKQAETFKRSYNVTWPVVPIKGGLKEIAEILPSDLVDVDPGGFPLTLFIAADRSLVAVHAGFPAADAPDEYRRVTAEIRGHIETILSRSK